MTLVSRCALPKPRRRLRLRPTPLFSTFSPDLRLPHRLSLSGSRKPCKNAVLNAGPRQP